MLGGLPFRAIALFPNWSCLVPKLQIGNTLSSKLCFAKVAQPAMAKRSFEDWRSQTGVWEREFRAMFALGAIRQPIRNIVSTPTARAARTKIFETIRNFRRMVW